MAEGLTGHFYGNRVHVQSAGSMPNIVHPLAIEVMHELGIDISSQRSKSVSTIDPKSVDMVITLCAEEVCPAFLGNAQRLHWPTPDPVYEQGSQEARREAFRTARDQIKAKLDQLMRLKLI